MKNSPEAQTERPAGARRAEKPAPEKPLTLAIDIGGTRLKATILDARGDPIAEPVRVLTPRPATPDAVYKALATLVAPLGPFDCVSAGFPGVVFDGVVKDAPNLHPTWARVELADRLSRLFKRPARVLNDAGIQGFGIVKGAGLEMVLTLGTGLGCGLFYQGTYIPNLELGHHPFRKGKTYEEYLGAAALESAGLEKWNRHLERALAQIDPSGTPIASTSAGATRSTSRSLCLRTFASPRTPRGCSGASPSGTAARRSRERGA